MQCSAEEMCLTSRTTHIYSGHHTALGDIKGRVIPDIGLSMELCIGKVYRRTHQKTMPSRRRIGCRCLLLSDSLKLPSPTQRIYLRGFKHKCLHHEPVQSAPLVYVGYCDSAVSSEETSLRDTDAP
eukprot:4968511-Amphidinium_carterae.1